MTFLRFLTYFCSKFAQSGARDDGGFLLSRGTQQQKQPKMSDSKNRPESVSRYFML